MPRLLVRATSRFISDFDRAQPLLRACAAGALGDLQRAFQSRPDLALKRYNTVKGLRPTVLEVDVAGGERMFAHWREGNLFLLGLGKHESTKHYQQTGRVEIEIQRCKPLPDSLARLTSAPFFTFDLEHDWKDFGTEADASWLAYLDQQQANAVTRIVTRARGIAPKDWYFAVVGGGPGTGKTSVLLSLFERAWECDLVPQVIVEDQVFEYVNSAVGIDLAPYRVSTFTAEAQSQGGEVAPLLCTA